MNAFWLWLPFLLLTGTLLTYWWAVYYQRLTNRKWNIGRTTSFTAGILILLVALMPTAATHAHHNIRGHMAQHLLIGMLAPIGLVLGAPVTLALRTLPVKSARLVTGLLNTNLAHLLGHPLTALVLNIGGMYVLYLTPLYTMSLTNTYVHNLIHIHFLAAGYLFTWSIVGPDPASKRPSLRTRLLVLFISMATHATLSKYMYAYLWPRHTADDANAIRQAAQLMYYGGDLSELLLAIVLFSIWYQKRGRATYKLAPLI